MRLLILGLGLLALAFGLPAMPPFTQCILFVGGFCIGKGAILLFVGDRYEH